MDGEVEAVSMSHAALARFTEATRARERQKIAALLDDAANRHADKGDADTAILFADFAERVRRMSNVEVAAEQSAGLYGSKVAGDGTPVIADVTYADVELADELPQVHLNDDETDALNLVARDEQRRALEAQSRVRAAG
jgi:phenylpyruvate tautomerase PptA (4-oxalocrotonate tautomerase family)